MIRTACLRASGFQGRTFEKRNDRPEQGLRSKVDAHHSTPHPDSVAPRSFADLAVQYRLGVLSEQRARIDSGDRTNPVPNGETLTGWTN